MKESVNDPIYKKLETGYEDWWGTALWSVYDKAMQRFVIIGALLTD